MLLFAVTIFLLKTQAGLCEERFLDRAQLFRTGLAERFLALIGQEGAGVVVHDRDFASTADNAALFTALYNSRVARTFVAIVLRQVSGRVQILRARHPRVPVVNTADGAELAAFDDWTKIFFFHPPRNPLPHLVDHVHLVVEVMTDAPDNSPRHVLLSIQLAGVDKFPITAVPDQYRLDRFEDQFETIFGDQKVQFIDGSTLEAGVLRAGKSFCLHFAIGDQMHACHMFLSAGKATRELGELAAQFAAWRAAGRRGSAALRVALVWATLFHERDARNPEGTTACAVVLPDE